MIAAGSTTQYKKQDMTMQKRLGIEVAIQSVGKEIRKELDSKGIPRQGPIDRSKFEDIDPHSAGWKDPGVAKMTIYEVEGEKYVIRGEDFRGQKKVTTGGAVEKGETLAQAANREDTEETFGVFEKIKAHKTFDQLSGKALASVTTEPAETSYALSHRNVEMKPGKHEVEETWGYDQVVGLDVVNGLGKADLETAVKKMNEYADSAVKAFGALTNGNMSDEDRINAAKSALENSELKSLIKDVNEYGEAALEALNNISNGIVGELPEALHFRSSVAEAVGAFSQRKNFELVPLETVAEDFSSSEYKGVFSEKTAVPELLKENGYI